MVTYLDLLPIDIQEIIEKNVNELYLEEHKEKMRDIQIELSSFWLIALWGSDLVETVLLKIYTKHQKDINILS